MQNAIKRQIKKLSVRAIERRQRGQSKEEHYRHKFEKRTNLPAGPPNSQPPYQPKHFDPIHCARNANFLAKTIWRKVLAGQYEITPAIHFEVKKPKGGTRPIMAFSIPDAALASVVMWRVRARNLKRMSASSFAYHPTKNIFDAVLELKNYAYLGKLFAVQMDFKKFFDSIPTAYLKDQMNNTGRISLTKHEKFVFEKFIYHRYAKPQDHCNGMFLRRYKGTPQGSSTSLLLANLANNELDIVLDSEAGKFVRFADDIVALCSTYEQAQTVEHRFLEHCRKSSLEINWNKSPGIAIISRYPKELRTYSGFDYLGYHFSEKGLTIPNKSIKRLKSRISRLLNIYLIHYLQYGFNPQRASVSPNQFDWDLLGFIYELRASIYAGLREIEIRDFINGGLKLQQMKGLMGFYCLVEDASAFKALDGWLLSVTRRTMQQRNQILTQLHSTTCPTPSNKELVLGTWLDLNSWKNKTKQLPDPRMPSFVRGWRAARKYYFSYGLEQVAAPGYDSSNDIGMLFDYS